MNERRCTRCSMPTDDAHEFPKCPACRVAIAAEAAAVQAARPRRRGLGAQFDQYGADEAMVASMFHEQGGACAACTRPVRIMQLGAGPRAHVDHCHRTGVVRGLLCPRCNGWLARLDDDIDYLERLAAYLRRGEALASDPAHPRGVIDRPLRPPPAA